MPGVERNQLLGQHELGGLMTTFTDQAAKIVRINSLYMDGSHPHVLIQHRPMATLNLHSYLSSRVASMSSCSASSTASWNIR